MNWMSCEFFKIQETKYLIKNRVADPAVVESYIPNIVSFFFNISGEKKTVVLEENNENQIKYKIIVLLVKPFVVEMSFWDMHRLTSNFSEQRIS